MRKTRLKYCNIYTVCIQLPQDLYCMYTIPAISRHLPPFLAISRRFPPFPAISRPLFTVPAFIKRQIRKYRTSLVGATLCRIHFPSAQSPYLPCRQYGRSTGRRRGLCYCLAAALLVDGILLAITCAKS